MLKLRIRCLVAAVLCVALGTTACASAPRFSGLTSREIYDRATAYLQQEEWDYAIQGYEALLFSDPTFEEAPQARIHLAEAYFGKEQYLSAAAEYERALSRYPDHEVAPEAALGICRSHVALSPIVQRDQEYTRQALQSCGNVADEFAGTEAARQAAELRDSMVAKLAQKDYERGKYYFDRSLYDSAIVFLQDVLERYPDTPAAPKALLCMYEAYVEIGYSEEAEAARQRLLNEYPESAAADEVRSAGDEAARADEGSAGGGPNGRGGDPVRDRKPVA